MWFLPSYGRPEKFRGLLEAPGGWPERVVVLVNEDDPQREAYNFLTLPWSVALIPAGSRCADAHRWITKAYGLHLKFYGLLMDDLWPVTPGWWQAMEQAAEDRYVVVANDNRSFPRFRAAGGFGGGLVRAMGSLVPPPLKHNFEDNVWDDIASEFNLLRPLSDVLVEHRHHIYGTAQHDETYLRGSADFALDAEIYAKWSDSPEKMAMNERIRDFLK